MSFPNFSGEYTAIFTNPAGRATSAGATLTVVLPPAPPRIEALALLSDNTVQLSVVGAAGGNFSILASPNLQDWSEPTNLTSVTGGFDFTDPEATNLAQRFYRVQPWPQTPDLGADFLPGTPDKVCSTPPVCDT